MSARNFGLKDKFSLMQHIYVRHNTFAIQVVTEEQHNILVRIKLNST